MLVVRIASFAVILFVLQVATGAALTLLVAIDEVEVLAGSQLIASLVVSICIYGYLSWAQPDKPYLTASLVGILATLLSITSTVILFGDLSWWDPTLMALDASVLLVAVPVGVSLGTNLRRRQSSKA